MKTPKIPKDTPCKSVVVENIQNVKNGKELTAPLAYLNRSCEFKKAYERVVGGTVGKVINAKPCVLKGAYQQTPEYKAKKRAYWKAYQQTPEYKAKKRAYQQTPEYKAKQRAYMRAYYQKRKIVDCGANSKGKLGIAGGGMR